MPIPLLAAAPIPVLHAGFGDMNTIVDIIIAVLIAIDVHELGHALVADSLGDDTARRAGHLSLNPFRHMDQFGVLMLFLLALTGTGFTYGYTPVNEGVLRRRTRFGPAIVALAGPAMNLLLALVLAFPLIHSTGLIVNADGSGAYALFGNTQAYSFVFTLFSLNVFLGVFNLVPLPPLDGWTILSGFLTARVRFQLRGLVQYGPMVLLLLFIFEPQIHFFGSVIDPVTSWVQMRMLAM